MQHEDTTADAAKNGSWPKFATLLCLGHGRTSIYIFVNFPSAVTYIEEHAESQNQRLVKTAAARDTTESDRRNTENCAMPLMAA